MIDLALLTLPPSGFNLYGPSSLDIPTLHYPDDNFQPELNACLDPQSADSILELCPVPSEAELQSLSAAIDAFIASVQEEEEKHQYAAEQAKEIKIEENY